VTQVIVAATHKYVLLASDRRLTFLSGTLKGQTADDDTCKLVSLCNICGIGYTGLAQIEGQPTHEWIAKTLAAEHCSDPAHASRTLQARASSAFSRVSFELRRHTFVIAGWACLQNLTGTRAHVCTISNMLDVFGRAVPSPLDHFNVFVGGLNDGDDVAVHQVGQTLPKDREQLLRRNLSKLIKREISAKAAMRLLVDEVVHSSTLNSSVGKKVLGLCIPLRAVESSIESGRSALLASLPCEDAASFCYFDPTYSELEQFGPTTTCGGFASTDARTENDPSTNFQSSQMRILAVPKNERQPVPQTTAIFKQPRAGREIIAFEFGIAADIFVVPKSLCTIPAAVRNVGDVPIIFAKTLADEVGQETPPSLQGGAVPAIEFRYPEGSWTINNFTAGSRSQFAGIVIAPGDLFEFDFGSFKAPNAPMGSITLCRLVDLPIRLTDSITATLLSIRGREFNFPTNVNPAIRFRISRKSLRSQLSFYPARVIDTATGELISGPVDGAEPPTGFTKYASTAIAKGSPGIFTGS
jgi:hypothetical protein